MSRRDWTPVTLDAPCPACGKDDWCAWTTKGWLKCERATEAPPDLVFVKLKHGGALFRPPAKRDLGGATHLRVQRSTTSSPRPATPAPNPADVVAPSGSTHSDKGPESASESGAPLRFETESQQFRVQLDETHRGSLAAALGVAPHSLDLLGCGWASEGDLRRLRAGGKGWKDDFPDGAFTFPEVDGRGRVSTLALRAADGRKGAPANASRGLIVPSNLKDLPDPVLLVEGASDVAACLTLGLAAVGRASNASGAELFAELLEGRDVLIVGERDQKDDGKWPGRDGARSVATRLAKLWDKEVAWTLPAAPAKDIRHWLGAKIASGLDIGDPGAAAAAGSELRDQLLAARRGTKPKKQPREAASSSTAELLVQLAVEQYRLGHGEDQEPFAVRRDGPNVALMLSGSCEKLKSQLARDFRSTHGRTAGVTAVGNALLTLRGIALAGEAEPVYLRVAQQRDDIVLDLGTADGRAVVFGPNGWSVVPRSPVLFRRTALTAALPDPVRGGSLQPLRRLLNVSEDSWQLVIGWLVAAVIADVSHPILLLGGGQGSGKTTAGRMLVDLFDASTVANHNQPRDPESWAMAANGAWCIFVDNISVIPGWWSDAMCKSIYGAGWVRRKLYSDSGLSVMNLRHLIVLTSIDAGAMRGDLGDRVMIIDLEPIPDQQRREERRLKEEYAIQRPIVMGALFDLVAKVLAARSQVHPVDLPRLADFGVVLATMDQMLGTRSLELYMAQRDRIADDIVSADPIGDAILAFIRREQHWRGTCQQLLEVLHQDRPPKGWPTGPRQLAGQLRRLAPDLRRLGVEVKPPSGNNKARLYDISLTAQTAQPPEKCRPSDGQGNSDQAVKDFSMRDRPGDRPIEAWPEGFDCCDSGRSGGSGGYFPISDDRASERVVGEVDS